MRISDWSSDVCSSDLMALDVGHRLLGDAPQLTLLEDRQAPGLLGPEPDLEPAALADPVEERLEGGGEALGVGHVCAQVVERVAHLPDHPAHIVRSEEHTSELQSLMRISYAGFCLKKKNNTTIIKRHTKKSE